jgi:hypothetical protein
MNRLTKKNADASKMPEEDRNYLFGCLISKFVKKIDYVNPDAFTTISDFSVGFIEDLIKKGKMFNQRADKVPPGTSNECFDNCMKMSNSRLKTYMGYALSDNKQAAIARGIADPTEDLCYFGWMIHCWLVDKKTNEIVETCPGNALLAYFGFQVNEDYIKDWVRSVKRYPITIAAEGCRNITLKNSQVLAEADRMGV